jgi:ATP-dependent Clp protease ATP-binding subunit ClpA
MANNNDYSQNFDRFTDNARKSLENAEQIAAQMGSSYIGTEHILLGILKQEGSIGAKILKHGRGNLRQGAVCA